MAGAVGVASTSSSGATKRRHLGPRGSAVPHAGVPGGKRHKGFSLNLKCPPGGSKGRGGVAAVAGPSAVDVTDGPSGVAKKPESSSPVDSPVGSPVQGGDGGGGGYNSEDEYSHLGLQLTEEEWQEKDRRFERQIRKKGFVIKYMEEDGSCLFRAVADQVYGDQDMHAVTRKHCMDYIVRIIRTFDYSGW